ncbi:hypothetical protein VBD025_02905 [Virgibacillus flavescens]
MREAKKQATARKFTRLPDDYGSQISKKNKRAIELLRQYKKI